MLSFLIDDFPSENQLYGARSAMLSSASSAAWSGFAPMLDRWLKVIEGRGPADVKRVYLDALNGRVTPDQGHILSLAT
jgi:hypothetical protein